MIKGVKMKMRWKCKTTEVDKYVVYNLLAPKSVIPARDPDRAVVTDNKVLRGTKFGPFPGEDAVQHEYSDWMQFVNGVDNLEDCNVVIAFYHKQLYFYSYRNIYPGMELFVWTGNKSLDSIKWIENEIPADDLCFPCLKCNGTFPTVFGITHHWNITHRPKTEEKGPFKCPCCPVEVTHKRNLRKHLLRHLNIHIDRGNFTAHNKRRKKLLEQQEDDDDEDEGYVFRCKLCPQKFYYKFHLGRHEATIHKDGAIPKPPTPPPPVNPNNPLQYRCNKCYKKFLSQTQLLTHRKVEHFPNNDYKCLMCNKMFASNPSRYRHMVTAHSNLKPYACSICKLSFKRSDKVKEHLRLKHEGLGSVVNDLNAIRAQNLEIKSMADRISTNDVDFDDMAVDDSGTCEEAGDDMPVEIISSPNAFGDCSDVKPVISSPKLFRGEKPVEIISSPSVFGVDDTPVEIVSSPSIQFENMDEGTAEWYSLYGGIQNKY